MKISTWMLSALFVVTPLAVQASCESVKADVNQKIIKNGIASAAFSLEIVPNDQVDQTAGQVVGHCDNDSQKIIYKRSANDVDSNAPVTADTSQDTPGQ